MIVTSFKMQQMQLSLQLYDSPLCIKGERRKDVTLDKCLNQSVHKAYSKYSISQRHLCVKAPATHLCISVLRISLSTMCFSANNIEPAVLNPIESAPIIGRQYDSPLHFLITENNDCIVKDDFVETGSSSTHSSRLTFTGLIGSSPPLLHVAQRGALTCTISY